MNSTSTILIVEDEAIVAMDLVMKLQSVGYNTLEVATNYDEAVDAIKTHQPNLVLLDIVIKSKKNGIDIGNYILNHYNIPIIYVTANTNDSIMAQVKKTNPYGFISKPFDSKTLFTTIEIANHKFKYEQGLIDTREKLKELNLELEKRVGERTRMLKEQNKHLQIEVELRNKVESELFVKEQHYKNIIKHLGSGLAVTDNKGIILSPNLALAKMCSCNEANLIGKNISDLFETDVWRKVQSHFTDEDNKLLFIETKLIRRNKAFKWCQLYISATKVYHSHNNFVFSVIDVNQQKITERLLNNEREKRLFTLMEGVEKERKRITLELHDSLGQKLTAAKLTLGALLRNSNIDDAQKEALIESKTIIEESINEVREISQNLTPSVLEDYGLIAALKRMKDQLSEKEGVDILLILKGAYPGLSMPVETVLYRIAQEALNNALKHAEASEIKITLTTSQEGLSLSISDNGKGFNIKDKMLRNGHGLNNIEDRCSAIKGHCSIDSQINKGTKILIEL